MEELTFIWIFYLFREDLGEGFNESGMGSGWMEDLEWI